MFWFKRVQHSQAQSFVRGPTQHTLAASAALPNSGNAAFDNAQGASAATASFSRELGAGIGDVVLDGDPADALKSQLHGLAKKAARFVNARPTFFANRAPWTGTRHDAVTITVAYECAAAIYEPGHWPGVQEWGLGFEHEVYRLPSADGSAKATGFSRIWELDVGGEKNPYFPALVVAVRGTGSRVDHIVNLNGRMQDARAFLVSICNVSCSILPAAKADAFDFKDPNFTRLHADVGGGPHAAHAGFLNGAVALLPEVTRRVNALVGEKPGPRNIMFTGHSAGGAVASLLFTRFMMEASEKCKCITPLCLTVTGAIVPHSFHTDVNSAEYILYLRSQRQVLPDNLRRPTRCVAFPRPRPRLLS